LLFATCYSFGVVLLPPTEPYPLATLVAHRLVAIHWKRAGGKQIATVQASQQMMRLRISLLLSLAPAAFACDARSMITRHEGKRDCVYTDTMGHPTVGIGYNLDNPGARQAIEALGADYDDVRSGAQCLTDSQVMKLFEPSYQSAVSGAKRAVSTFSSLCCGVQEVMVDMDYNLGDAGFASFSGFIGLVNDKDWAGAAADGKNTAWCSQVGSRCTDDMARVAKGCEGPAPGPSPHSGGCRACVTGGGGVACAARCTSCSADCLNCIRHGGGKACADRCCDSATANASTSAS